MERYGCVWECMVCLYDNVWVPEHGIEPIHVWSVYGVYGTIHSYNCETADVALNQD